jgi:5-methylcytosine-specific restriction endonuclease McrA
MGQVLLLNADYQPLLWSPLSTVDWRFAVKGYYLDKLNVLEWYKEFKCRSINTGINMPSVIVLKKFFQTTQRLNPVRKNILLRDNFTCQYCMKHLNEHELTLDHVHPKSKGGENTWTNLVTACRKCNVKKGSFHKMKPIKEPKELFYWEMVSVIKHKKIIIPDASWQKYINWPNENIRLTTPKFI